MSHVLQRREEEFKKRALERLQKAKEKKMGYQDFLEANEIQMEDPTFCRSSVKKINQDIIEDLKLDQSAELRQR